MSKTDEYYATEQDAPAPKKVPAPHGPGCYDGTTLTCGWPDKHPEKPPKKTEERCPEMAHNGAGRLVRCGLRAGHLYYHRSETGGLMLR